MLVEKENSTPLMEEDKLPNLTGKIKTDEKKSAGGGFYEGCI